MLKNTKVRIRFITISILFFASMGIFTNKTVHGEEKQNYPKIGQWKPSKDIQVFTEDNLFDYINGASELYLSYEFRQLDVVYYKNRNKQEIVLEVYKHLSPVYAYGIYSQERSPDVTFVQLGTESYFSGSYLYILAGKYYIKIYSYDLEKDAEQILLEFAKSLLESFKYDSNLPKLIQAFPSKYLVAKSEQFIARNLLGYSFFNNGYQAFYDINSETGRLFIIESQSIRESNELYDQYLQQLHHAPIIPGSIEYKVNDPYHGIGIIRKCAHFIYGGFGISDIEQLTKLLDRMKENICR